MRRLTAPFAVLGLLLILPSTALASQTLTVERTGSGTGTVKSSPAGIDCGPTCSFAFGDGELVTLTGTPGANSGAVQWSGCDSLDAENHCLVALGEAKAVTATFNLVQRLLTVSRAGTGAGTVKSSPAGIDCGTECSATFPHGTAVTLTATPGANTSPVQWLGCNSVTTEGKCLVTMGSARSVTATFDLERHQLSVLRKGTGTGVVKSSPAGINCGTTCLVGFDHGVLVTLTAAPGANTEAAQWSGCDSLDAENHCLVTMSEAKAVTATFNRFKRQLIVSKIGNGAGTVTSSPTGINCGETCSASIDIGTAVTLTGTPGIHTQPVKWAGCDEITAEGKCVVAMSGAREVTASFALEPQYVEYTVNLVVKGTATGSVVSFPSGISCPGDCAQSYVFKTPVTLIATPAPGAEFAHWSGGSCTGTGPCERKINSDRTVYAVFKAIGNRTLTVAREGSGQGLVTSKPAAIECGSTCSAELDASTKVTLHATALPGSTFTGWSGEGCSGIGYCRVLMNEARNVTATFAKNPPPPEVHCRVPRLKGKALAKARSALFLANCSLGKVKRPKGKGPFVVGSSKPGAGAVRPAGARVALRLVRKRR